MGAIDVAAFAKAISSARKHLRQTQSVFGRRFGVGRQAVARWEAGSALPADGTLAVLAKNVADLPDELRLAILIALGADPPARPAPPVVAVAAPRVDVRAVMEGIVFRAAEELDLGPRRVRAAIVHALAEMDRRGIAVRVGHDALVVRLREVAVSEPEKRGD